jgi:hypothetical protein
VTRQSLAMATSQSGQKEAVEGSWRDDFDAFPAEGVLYLQWICDYAGFCKKLDSLASFGHLLWPQSYDKSERLSPVDASGAVAMTLTYLGWSRGAS